jgi:hypothetical protein
MLLMGSDRVLERAREAVRKQPIRIAAVPIALWALYLILTHALVDTVWSVFFR